MVAESPAKFGNNDIIGIPLLIASVIFLGLSYVVARDSRLNSDISPLTFVACCMILNSVFLLILHIVQSTCLPPCQEELDQLDCTWPTILYWSFLSAVTIVG